MDTVRRSATQPGDDALAKKILLSLTEVDREAIVRFYFERQSAEQIEEALGLDARYLRRLKGFVKARFLTTIALRGNSQNEPLSTVGRQIRGPHLSDSVAAPPSSSQDRTKDIRIELYDSN
jgi:hypothetical protein